MKTLFNFLISKLFLKNVVLAIVLLFVLVWGVLKWLDTYTHHQEVVEVPDFTGIKIANLDDFIKDKRLNYVIIDSVFDPKAPKGIVIRQEPEKKVNVKENRTIYLYVTTLLPPLIELPKLRDKSLRQAASILQTYGLKLGRLRFVPDQCSNCVLYQTVKGKKVEPGTSIPKGTVIDLVVGKGLSDVKVPVPNLIGLTWMQASDKLAESSLNEGAVKFEQPADTLRAKIYRQLPNAGNEAQVNMGASIDLFFTNKKEQVPIVNDSTNVE